MVRAAALALTVGALTIAAVAPDRPSFQGYTVGMTLDEVKAVPIPPDRSGRVTIRCVGEPDAPTTLTRTPDEAAAGITVCAPASDIRGTPWMASLYLADDIQVQSRFSFLHGRLFSTSNIIPEIHREAVKGALVVRYGEPTIRETKLLTNAFGAEVEQELLIWSFRAGMVSLTAPEGSRAAMSLYYADTALGVEATDLMRAARASRIRL